MNIQVVASLLAIALFSHSPASLAYSLTGNDLLHRCDGPYANEAEHLIGNTFCQGYIQGIQQMHHVMIDLRNVAPLYCEPVDSGSYDQLQQVLVKYLKANPEEQHRDARILVTAAFARAFPSSTM